MAADRNTPEGVENWLIQSSTNPWLFPSIVGPELTREILQHICSRWNLYPSNIKLGVLFALLCIRKLLLSSMGNELTAIITNGCNDNDEWVRLVSKMLQNYPSTGTLDLNIEQHIPEDAQLGLQSLMERIQQTGIKFHPTEYAFIDRDISDAFSTLSINTEAVRSPSSHFTLRQGIEISKQQRLHALNNVAMPPPSPGLTSPVNATGFNFMSDQNRIGSSQGLPSNRSTTSSGPSLFIPPKRRPSQLSQPFHRPPNPSRGSFSGSTQGPDSPTEPKITQGKKYVKPTKIQMLDITTATTITRNQEETKLKTQMDDETVEDEIVSDEELPHKKPKKAVAPTSSLSPTHLYQPDNSTDNFNTVMISQNGSGSNPVNTSTTAEPVSSVSEHPMAADLELPKSQFEEIPKIEMTETMRKQFEMNCGAVLDKSNKIHGDNRQLIINFLGGHHTKPEQREKLMSISSGVSCNEDEIRHIILHEEKTPIPNEGKEIQETFIFEMNLSNGQWRKLKRKKTKAVKNPNLEALNGRPN
ncbi:5439_t:CDS:2, partial [Rhizophagus irregularis]